MIHLYPLYSRFSNQPIFEIFEKKSEEELTLSKLASPFFKLVLDPLQADWIVIPIFSSGLTSESGKALVLAAHQLAQKSGKPLAIFSNSDIIVDPQVSPVTIFTPGSYASMKNQVELPALLPYDPIERWQNGTWKPFQYTDKATLGFCGQATRNPLKFLKDWFTIESLRFQKKKGTSPFLHIPRFLPAFERGRLLRSLEKSKKLKTDFLLRSHYKAGASTLLEKNKVEEEFYANIEANLFTVCLRGMGNYSVRFYQTLAMGRIPILIDTDSNLPFSSRIDYEQIMVRVPFSDRFRTADYVLDFLESKTAAELTKIQEACRRVWLDNFNTQAMLKNLSEEMRLIQARNLGSKS